MITFIVVCLVLNKKEIKLGKHLFTQFFNAEIVNVKDSNQYVSVVMCL